MHGDFLCLYISSYTQYTVKVLIEYMNKIMWNGKHGTCWCSQIQSMLAFYTCVDSMADTNQPQIFPLGSFKSRTNCFCLHKIGENVFRTQASANFKFREFQLLFFCWLHNLNSGHIISYANIMFATATLIAFMLFFSFWNFGYCKSNVVQRMEFDESCFQVSHCTCALQSDVVERTEIGVSCFQVTYHICTLQRDSSKLCTRTLSCTRFSESINICWHLSGLSVLQIELRNVAACEICELRSLQYHRAAEKPMSQLFKSPGL